eukprot:TRINITY_DN161_c0_g1_i1.p1 TRINITY_DN161_c0_g1~~TRINITY_DN161_c0_g1_i1.p1  ORF type:complete len:334 (+),score=139.26 TRINITY_DN161_c0_g1_i1:224-1225(+)
MNLYKILFLVSIYLAFVNCIQGEKFLESCPEVYDGLTNARFDLQTQYSSNSISANWKISMNAIKYEWAIISDNQYQYIRDLEQCRNSIGFNAIPDVQDWKNVNVMNFASNDDLVLKEREKYYVIVRTTFKDGKQAYSHSNGVLIVPQPEEAIAIDEVVEKKHNDMLVSHLKREIEYVQERAHIAVPNQDECPIDADNRCRASKIRVYDRLTEIYGPPIFDDRRPIRDDDDGDDDDGDDDDESSGAVGSYPAGIVGAIIGILALLAILCCLLALVGFFIAAVGGGDDDKFNDRIYAKPSDDVDGEYGTKEEYKVEDSTRVEFPDIDPHSRLSAI